MSDIFVSEQVHQNRSRRKTEVSKAKYLRLVLSDQQVWCKNKQTNKKEAVTIVC